MNEIFENYLLERINNNLPGLSAHLKMAPEVNGKAFRNFKPGPEVNPKRSAALIPLFKNDDDDNDYKILLTLRNSNLKAHAGQISFPGGRIEKGESPKDAALRETFEEVGIPINYARVVGALTDLYVPPSNSLITPFVAFFDFIPELNISRDEVSDYFYVSLKRLASFVDYKKEKRKIDGYDVDFPFWDVYSGTPLWGATAMILSELIDIYQNFTRLFPIVDQ